MMFDVHFWKQQPRVLLLSILAIILFSCSALSCTCAPTTPEMEREDATVVFAGKVLTVEKIGLPHLIITKQFPFIELFGPFKTKTIFAVSQVWKGPIEQKFEITSCVGMMCCLSEFNPGDEFLVYAFGPINELNAGMCTRTQKLENATDDLQELGVGTQVAQNDSPTGVKKAFWSVVEGFAEFFRR